MFNGKVVMITGGTGSFGKMMARTILEQSAPKRLIIFSRDELKQFEMQQRFRQECMRYFIGDVRDSTRVLEAMEGVDYLIHAAAMKQVPAAEYNPMECIKTNIYGAENLIRAAIAHKVERIIALSTDKAANPINLYGATKLASDKLFVAANNMVGGRKTRFSVVRYGNVLGSRGSVVPFFQQLIDSGSSELPITHPDMTRFIITLQRGVEFVNQSLRRMQGGEIFIPKIPSMKMTELANALGPKCKQKIVGIRPGEKLHETLCPADDDHLTIEFSDHFVICPTIQFAHSCNFKTNALGEVGVHVKPGFSYHSGNNSEWLDEKTFWNLMEQKSEA